MCSFSDALAEKGFAFMPFFCPRATGAETACRLGRIWQESRQRAHQLTPTAIHQSTPNTYSGRYGFDRFPLHTDLAHHRRPPHYFMLRSERGYADVVTHLIDGLHLVGAVGASLLARALVQPRRSRSGERPLMPLFQPHDGETGLLRWDEVYIRPASSAGKQAFAAITHYLATTTPMSVSLTEPGDTLIVDNWRMIHGRSAVPSHCADRVIERTYFEEAM
jgi:hypothetical protein